MRRRALTTEPEYHGYSINVGTNNTLACDKAILNTIERVADNFFDQHARSLVTRFDFRFPEGYTPNGNNEIKEIMKQTVAATQRHAGTKPAYILVREHSKDEGYHYNGLLLLDNSMKRSPINVLRDMERVADHICKVDDNSKTNQGLVQHCVNSTVVHRDNEDERRQALYRASYLAKLKDKEDIGREVLSSKTLVVRKSKCATGVEQ